MPSQALASHHCTPATVTPPSSSPQTPWVSVRAQNSKEEVSQLPQPQAKPLFSLAAAQRWLLLNQLSLLSNPSPATSPGTDR